jgi:hypothetical protein
MISAPPSSAPVNSVDSVHSVKKMNAQPELPLRTSEQIVTDDDIAVVKVLLSGQGWMTAKQIAEDPAFMLAYPGKSPATRERFIRMIARAGRPEILSYPGSPGYILYAEASAAERQAAPTVLRHQADDMRTSADLYEHHARTFSVHH